MPNTPPSSRSVLFTPDAFPTASGATAPMTAFCAEGSAIETPQPAITSAGTSSTYAIAGSATSAIQPRPMRLQQQPAGEERAARRSGRRARPATGATKNSVAVHGSSRSPASSASSPRPVCRNCARKNTAREQRGERQEDRAVARRERARAEHRRAAASAPAPAPPTHRNAPSSSEPGGERSDDLGAAPAGRLPRTRPQTTPTAASVMSARPGQVERAVARRGSRASAPARPARRRARSAR